MMRSMPSTVPSATRGAWLELDAHTNGCVESIFFDSIVPWPASHSLTEPSAAAVNSVGGLLFRVHTP